MKTTYTIQIQKPDNEFWHTWAITDDENRARELADFFQVLGISNRVVQYIDSGLPLVKDPSLS